MATQSVSATGGGTRKSAWSSRRAWTAPGSPGRLKRRLFRAGVQSSAHASGIFAPSAPRACARAGPVVPTRRRTDRALRIQLLASGLPQGVRTTTAFRTTLTEDARKAPTAGPVHAPLRRKRLSRPARNADRTIGQLLAAPPPKGELRAQIEALAGRQWRHPITGEPARFGFSTIERWFYRALKERSDPVAAARNERRGAPGRAGAVCRAQELERPASSRQSRRARPDERRSAAFALLRHLAHSGRAALAAA